MKPVSLVKFHQKSVVHIQDVSDLFDKFDNFILFVFKKNCFAFNKHCT